MGTYARASITKVVQLFDGTVRLCRPRLAQEILIQPLSPTSRQRNTSSCTSFSSVQSYTHARAQTQQYHQYRHPLYLATRLTVNSLRKNTVDLDKRQALFYNSRYKRGICVQCSTKRSCVAECHLHSQCQRNKGVCVCGGGGEYGSDF